METSEVGTAGPIRNALFLDDNGLPLEATWPKPLKKDGHYWPEANSKKAEVLTG